jgi:flagellar biosynthesis protein FliQ
MEVDTAISLGIRVLMLAMLICAPILLTALIVGVLVSILQAVTQIQEMTLTFVPKVVAMVVVTIIFMPFIAAKLLAFASEMFGPMPIP